MNNNNKNQTLGQSKKPGRTLLVKVEESSFNDSLFEKLAGLSTKFLTEKTQSYFLTFDSVNSSEVAFESLSKLKSIKVKYAHYRIFFTMKELTAESDYTKIRQNHIEFIEKNTGTNVLYYKLYRKNNSFIGCGDLTIDTKEAFDMLMDSESTFKEFQLDDNLSGVHYRYNRRQNNSSHQQV